MNRLRRLKPTCTPTSPSRKPPWRSRSHTTVAAATNRSMLDGFVTAVVAGPVSMDSPEWICPLLGIGIDAFNHGGTPEFAAISAVAVRHNAIVETFDRTQDLRADLRAQTEPRH